MHLDRFVSLSVRFSVCACINIMGLCKEKNSKKSEITMEVGGWVQISLGILFCFENHPKIALNQYRYFGVVGLHHLCILSVYTLLKVVSFLMI